jgi:hypothetical protein
MASSGHRHPENRSDFLTLSDFAWCATGSLKPFHQIRDPDLMFDAHLSNGHLHNAEPFLDTFHPLVFAQRRQPLRDSLEK